MNTNHPQLRAAWTELTRDRASLPPSVYMLYSLLRGKPANHGFTPITNPTKLANGQQAWDNYNTARATLRNTLNTGKALQPGARLWHPAFQVLLSAAEVSAEQVLEGGAL